MPTHRGVKFDFSNKPKPEDDDTGKIIWLMILSVIAMAVGVAVIVPLLQQFFPK